LPRKPKQESEPPLPSREAILDFLSEQSGKVGKREIARAFGITGGERIGLKRLLGEMADEGLIEGKRKRLLRSGDLPSVTVLAVESISDDGDLLAVPVEWDSEGGAPPRITVASATPGRRTGEPAPGLGDRVLARLTPDPDTGGYTARVIKLLERPPKATLGIYRETDGMGRVVPIDRRGSELMVLPGAVNGAQDGELVSVEITKSGRHGLPSARVLDRVGDVSSEKAISLIALQEHGIPTSSRAPFSRRLNPPHRPTCPTGRIGGPFR
jgi:ribonuclease R